MKKGLKITLIVFGVIIGLGIILYFAILFFVPVSLFGEVFDFSKTTPKTTQSPQSIQTYDEPMTFTINNTKYEIAATGDKIILKNLSDDKTQVPNIRSKIDKLSKNLQAQTKVFANPANANNVILATYYPDTDNPSQTLYRYTPANNEFNRLDINEIYDGFFGGFAMSTDKTKFVWAPSTQDEDGLNQTMYLINLDNDIYKEIVSLNGNQTFNAGGFAMSANFDIAFIDNDQIKYAIYDQSLKTDESKSKDVFIEYKTIDLK